jgi:glycosyltransferase involved in cell wall biosynthesis
LDRTIAVMRVALDVGPIKPKPAGVGLYVDSLASALPEYLTSEELTFIGHREDAPPPPLGYPTTMRPSRLPYPVWVELMAARDAKRAAADIVHYTDGLVPPIRHGRSVVTVLDLSMVRHWRSHRAVRYPRIPLVLAAPWLANRVVVPSTATANEVIALTRCPAARIDVIPLAGRTDARPATADQVARTLERLGLVRNRYILALGTIEPRKNHVRLIRAFESLAKRRAIADDIQLALAGGLGWGHRAVTTAIEDSPTKDRIKLLGYVSEIDLPSLLTGAAVVPYVSLYEGFGLPVLEAMACGAPVVTSSVSSMPEVAGEAAVLVDPYDIEAIADAIHQILSLDSATRAQMILAGSAQAESFSWSNVALLTSSTYRVMDR